MPTVAPGLLLGPASYPRAVVLSMTGSYLGGQLIGANAVPSSPFLFSNNVTAATWMMCYCDGTKLNMAQLIITVSTTGLGYVYSGDAGYTASTCTNRTLTQAVVFAAWNSRTSVNVATCGNCTGVGVQTLIYSIAGTYVLV